MVALSGSPIRTARHSFVMNQAVLTTWWSLNKAMMHVNGHEPILKGWNYLLNSSSVFIEQYSAKKPNVCDVQIPTKSTQRSKAASPAINFLRVRFHAP